MLTQPLIGDLADDKTRRMRERKGGRETMYEITIRGIPELSQEELQIFTQRFHEFTGRQHASGRRYESMTALLKEFLDQSCYDHKARIINDPHQEATDLIYQTTKGTFDRPSKFQTQPDPPENKADSISQEAMHLILENITNFGRGR